MIKLDEKSKINQEISTKIIVIIQIYHYKLTDKSKGILLVQINLTKILIIMKKI